jgi:hypothetical protein
MNEHLINHYEYYCEQIVSKFAIKQEIEFDGWVSDEVGGLAAFCGHQYFFNMYEIVRDLKTNQPSGLILDWHNENLEASPRINYFSYTL